MDGKGADGQGPCARDSPDFCGQRTKFSNFSVAAIPGTACKAKLTDQRPAEPDLVVTDAQIHIRPVEERLAIRTYPCRFLAQTRPYYGQQCQTPHSVVVVVVVVAVVVSVVYHGVTVL